jgi:hypothetical protein
MLKNNKNRAGLVRSAASYMREQGEILGFTVFFCFYQLLLLFLRK